MRASPSAVTRFGCGEIGRSGSSSTASSSSLTNALLMRSFLLLRSRSANRPVIIWDVDGQRGTLKAELDAPSVRGFVRNYFARKKLFLNGCRHRFLLRHVPCQIHEL